MLSSWGPDSLCSSTQVVCHDSDARRTPGPQTRRIAARRLLAAVSACRGPDSVTSATRRRGPGSDVGGGRRRAATDGPGAHGLAPITRAAAPRAPPDRSHPQGGTMDKKQNRPTDRTRSRPTQDPGRPDVTKPDPPGGRPETPRSERTPKPEGNPIDKQMPRPGARQRGQGHLRDERSDRESGRPVQLEDDGSRAQAGRRSSPAGRPQQEVRGPEAYEAETAASADCPDGRREARRPWRRSLQGRFAYRSAAVRDVR